MSNMVKWLYTQGFPSPHLAGRSTQRDHLGPFDTKRIETAARLLGRNVRDVYNGFQREIIGATSPDADGRLAYAESVAKEVQDSVEVSFNLLIRDVGGAIVGGCELESYNPFFGCRLRYLKWWGESVIGMYREKHTTIICRTGVGIVAVFVPIGDDWTTSGETLEYRNRDETVVRRLSLPLLLPRP